MCSDFSAKVPIRFCSEISLLSLSPLSVNKPFQHFGCACALGRLDASTSSFPASEPIHVAQQRIMCNCASIFHSFITEIYIAPLQGYYSEALPTLARLKRRVLTFETRVECVRKNPGKRSLRQRKPIPHRGTNHRECTGLGCGCTSKRNKE